MAQINVNDSYFDNAKSKRLRARLGEMADVLPIRLWCYAARQYPQDGVFKNCSEEEISSLINYKGDANGMLMALLEFKFLEKTSEGWYKIHEWEEWQGHIISFSRRAKNNANIRWNKEQNANGNASSNATRYAPTNQPTIPTNKKNNSVFIPPTAEQVSAYAKEMGFETFDANNYIDYNERQGWITKPGIKMKSWKADVRYAWRFKSGKAIPKKDKWNDLNKPF